MYPCYLSIMRGDVFFVCYVSNPTRFELKISEYVLLVLYACS